MSDTTIDDVEAEFARIRREYRGIGEGAWASAKWYAEALVRSRAELQCALKDRTEERDALLADLRKCEQQLIAVTPVTHTSHDARVALVRQAIFTVLDEANPRTPGLAWDFNDDEQRVDFADRVVSFIPSESEVRYRWLEQNYDAHIIQISGHQAFDDNRRLNLSAAVDMAIASPVERPE